MRINLETAAVGAASLALIGLALWFAKKGVAGVAADVVGATTDAAAGAVVGIGQAVGIPATSESECARAMREGRTWDASFACPAADFLRYVTGSQPQGIYGQ
jgi:hypothetical protein